MSAAGDVREGGAWSPAQRAKNDALYVMIRAALAVLVPLPAALLRAIGRAIALVALVALRRERRVADANLAIAFPSLAPRERRALRRRAYVTLGSHLGDALASLDADRPIAPLAIDDADLALLLPRGEGVARGVVFVSAHLGPWERVAATLVARGVPLTAVTRGAYDARLDAIYARLREGRGVRAIDRGHPGAAARIVRVLRAGEVLGVPMDLRARVASIDAPLFDRPARTAIGPARIALRAGADVVVGTVAPDPRAPDRLRVTCTPIATPASTDPLAPLDADAAARALTERINAELAARIRALPAHWPWMHDRFDLRDRTDRHDPSFRGGSELG